MTKEEVIAFLTERVICDLLDMSREKTICPTLKDGS